ncbi:MAG: hypothetical protein IPO21_12900 [Bacteroidales bacterium]|nr:hypothetical protein [Bacteroidales bacterium]
MKKIITILSVTALIFGFTSCNKCVTCTYDDGLIEDEEVCESDHDSKLSYDFYIEVTEAFGATCK